MSKSILIVDDNPNMSALLSEMLEVFDYESELADDGAQALEKVQNGNFSMVITDMRMPNMTGLELLQKVKGINPELPVVLISGYNVAAEEEMAVAPDGFLSKPFMMNDVRQLLDELL